MTKPNEQTKIIERDLQKLADDHRKLGERFDRHLEIYAQNGKELVALRTTMMESHKNFEALFAKTSEALHITRTELQDIRIEMGRVTTKLTIGAMFVGPMVAAVIVFLVNKIVV